MAHTSRLATALARTNTVSPARLAAFEILLRVEDGAYASILLAQKEPELAPRDRALCHELVMGVLRWQLWLDRLAEHFTERASADLDVAIRLILRLGLYQLRFLSRVPASAIVNESVNLVHRARLRSAGALVNAVLRRAAREPDVDPAQGMADPLERLAVSTSHPAWLIERWTTAFGVEETEAFARSNNQPAPIAFRVVTQRASEVEIITQLRASGAKLEPSKIAKHAWRITGNGPLFAELVAGGQIYVQDEASQMVAQVLDARAGERILDLCAAPGSKTTQIASALRDTGVVIASDLHAHRLRTVRDTTKQHHLSNVHCLTLNGVEPLPFREKSFDRVLVDAPCSGSGTFRRNPEIRWRISADDIDDLASRQNRLLLNAAPLVKPGGRLVYSTCSVEPEENESVVQTFLENNINFSLLPLPLSNLLSSAGTLRTWPQHHDTDGFFIASLQRSN
ncbi:MAG: rRNA (cytosine967-C5)-methyltransferase [Pyrinomonadaceae bacterium]|jgi:16S rRNA (cytosine967-C5)-methyltransferase|nr:rRNA (cytosine967-C5)-methyltransferase [Pyrinomonadaceae bacterium]